MEFQFLPTQISWKRPSSARRFLFHRERIESADRNRSGRRHPDVIGAHAASTKKYKMEAILTVSDSCGAHNSLSAAMGIMDLLWSHTIQGSLFGQKSIRLQLAPFEGHFLNSFRRCVRWVSIDDTRTGPGAADDYRHFCCEPLLGNLREVFSSHLLSNSER
jgi:hypothetical protein